MVSIKRIDDYPNYTISDDGVIMSYGRNSNKEVRLRYGKTKAGYCTVQLCNDGFRKLFYVHRLVAKYFIDEPLSRWIKHRDGDKDNNSFDNLEYVSSIYIYPSRRIDFTDCKSRGIYLYCFPDGRRLSMTDIRLIYQKSKINNIVKRCTRELCGYYRIKIV
jgi:hypothetical protein